MHISKSTITDKGITISRGREIRALTLFSHKPFHILLRSLAYRHSSSFSQAQNTMSRLQPLSTFQSQSIQIFPQTLPPFSAIEIGAPCSEMRGGCSVDCSCGKG